MEPGVTIYRYNITWIDDYDNERNQTRGILFAENVTEALERIVRYYGEAIEKIAFEEIAFAYDNIIDLNDFEGNLYELQNEIQGMINERVENDKDDDDF